MHCRPLEPAQLQLFYLHAQSPDSLWLGCGLKGTENEARLRSDQLWWGFDLMAL